MPPRPLRIEQEFWSCVSESLFLTKRRAARTRGSPAHYPGIGPQHPNSEKMEIHMKYKLPALLLALTLVSWAQTSTPTVPPAPQQNAVPAEKGKCSCCSKAANGDSTSACCARHSTESKEKPSCCSGQNGKSCCGGKDAKSCMRNAKGSTGCCSGCKDKAAAACCSGTCGKDCGAGCCSRKSEKTA